VSTYQYRCPQHGPIDVQLPIGSATPLRACTACGTDMTRIFTAPMLGRGSSRLMTAIDRTRATADVPAVVSRVPGSTPSAPAAPVNPAWRRLPRP
jgi:hypothetical protein